MKVNGEMDAEIKKIIHTYESAYGEEISERLRDRIFEISFTAQRKGFLLGMRYAAKLYQEIMGCER